MGYEFSSSFGDLVLVWEGEKPQGKRPDYSIERERLLKNAREDQRAFSATQNRWDAQYDQGDKFRRDFTTGTPRYLPGSSRVTPLNRGRKHFKYRTVVA